MPLSPLSPRRLRSPTYLALAASVLGGCAGEITEGTSVPDMPRTSMPAAPAGEGSTPDTPGTPSLPGTPNTPRSPTTAAQPNPPVPLVPRPAAPMAEADGLSNLQRLSKTEYNNTVRDLLGFANALGSNFPEAPVAASGFKIPGPIGDVELDGLTQAAARVATASVSATNLKKLAPCAVAEDTCAQTFIATFGKSAYRRPLEPDEIAALTALYRKARLAPILADYAGAVRVLIEAILDSPQFLYRSIQGGEVDKSRMLARLTPDELASRLSYTLWQTMPDAELFAAASAGTLTDPVQFDKQARRMMASPKAQPALVDIYYQWLHLDGVRDLNKDTREYKIIADPFGARVRNSIENETKAFIKYAAIDQGTLEALLLSPVTSVDMYSAQLYKLPGITGTGAQQISLDPAERPGLLTRLGFLWLGAYPYGSSPVKRGKVIRERLLCSELPPPPPNVNADPPGPAPDAQTREQFEAHSKDPACAVCHRLMDPIGYALEGFDGVGQFRSVQSGRPVNDKGALVGVDGGDVSVTGPAALAKALYGSQEVRRCVSTQLTQFMVGRELGPLDRPEFDAVHARFLASKLDLRELLLSVMTSRLFHSRPIEKGEVLQ